MTGLVWESAGTDHPGDQWAPSRLAARADWLVGFDNHQGWAAELIVRDADGDEQCGEGVHVGHHDTEQAAKDAAERREQGGPLDDDELDAR